MEWILIILMDGNYSAASEQITFPTQQSCERAGEGVTVAAEDSPLDFVFTVCVEVPPKVRM